MNYAGKRFAVTKRLPAFPSPQADSSKNVGNLTESSKAMHWRQPRRLRDREKLPHFNTVEDVLALIRKSRKIMILTGAGISNDIVLDSKSML